MECKNIALALVTSLALTIDVPAQQGSSQLIDPSQDPVEDPLEGNHSCPEAFDLVPGLYEGLTTTSGAPDYYRLFVPAEQTLHVLVNIREWSHDFTMEVRDECDGELIFEQTYLVGTIPIELENASLDPAHYMFRLFRDTGQLSDGSRIGYDLLIAEGSNVAYPYLCVGDGSVTNCPCGNLGDAQRGCSHSGGHGARLVLGGSQFDELGGLMVEAIALPPQTPALLFTGGLSGEAIVMPFNDGTLCFGGGSVVRHGARFADALGSAYWTGDFDASTGRDPGEQIVLQVWFRDPEGPCGTGSNFTQAVRMRVKP